MYNAQEKREWPTTHKIRMTPKNIPHDLLCLIWDFTYNVPGDTSPLKDLETQFEIQRSIPPCFLMSQLPKPEWNTCSDPVYLCGPYVQP